jgi:16S rRNA (guanine(1405)-N(7))-methyltransferase
MKDELQPLVDEILAMKKYREMGILPDTVRDLLLQELPLHRHRKDAIDAVRKKLHNIVAPYLGDPDYANAAGTLDQAFQQGDESVRAACRQLLASHASTNERLPILAEFYPRLFAVTGTPATILDLACGLNPFAFPWMGLDPAATRYYAYEIHQPRVALINHYFRLQGLPLLAEARDILASPPEQSADVAFFFKEAHRFEQRRRGSSLPFWQSIRARWILVSLPTSSLSGKHDLLERQRHLVYSAIAGQPWQVSEVLFASEIVFCLDKSHDA